MMVDVKINEKLRFSIPWLLWGLWKQQNIFIFEGIQGDINSFISSALEETDLFMHQQVQLAAEMKLNQ